MLNPLVSIIIPSFNNGVSIIPTLSSVANQTLKQWECVIVDDHSTDETPEIINNFIKDVLSFVYHKRPTTRNKGANSCRNFGVEKARGKYILFLDSDDLLLKTCLENRVSYLEENNTLDFAIFQGQVLKEDGTTNRPKSYVDGLGNKNHLSSFLQYNLPWCTISPLWKKEVLQKVKWDENLLRLQDVDFHIRVLQHQLFSYEVTNILDFSITKAVSGKINSKKHVDVVLQSLSYFFKKHSPWILKEEKLKEDFKKFVIYFLHKYVYPSQKGHNATAKSLKKEFFNSDLFTKSDKMLLSINKWYQDREALKKRVFLRYRFSKIFKNHFNIA